MVKIKLEDSIESPTQEFKIKSKEKPKTKLRSLVKKTEPKYIPWYIRRNHKKLSTKESKASEEEVIQSKWKWKSLALAGVTLIASFFISKLTISSCGFYATYENNYNKIVYGDESWCYLKLDPSLIIEKLKERVIAQDDAISLIKGSLSLVNREKIIQIALTGVIGVGKTLTANVIMENFKWQENVNSLIFDINFQAHLKSEEAYESDYNEVSSRLSDCGFNLVCIDDVDPKESTTVERIKELERRLHRVAKQNLYKIVLIVIFRGSTEELAVKLDNFVLIEFGSFNEEMFQKCIEVHEKLHNVKLTSKDMEELKFINFTQSGCKTLAKKLNLIAKK